ncbi:hypothetical protein BBOV_III004130 [Babesia bovis T2Bo]|uniref:Uncharacterized protein n=1 Tax=Babesia bovis TaxID=5865 RepID=A7AN42_BABBO|nr:hypothetical protein BBOV_III004130 [Babesia bovis T2Bo]EDO07976.1 hypothetical protein BBOV_III004130 [Babesia bovis T2Bo]|eukprot:XP_001611544.1 hypothetical protein [Babesia bovis T2Bo]
MAHYIDLRKVILISLYIMSYGFRFGKGPFPVLVYAVNDEVDMSVPPSTAESILPSIKIMVENVPHSVELLESVKTILRSINNILGYTDNSFDLHLLDKFGGLYSHLHNNSDSCINDLLNKAKILTETISLSIEEVEHGLMELFSCEEHYGISCNNDEHLNKIYKILEKLLTSTLPAAISAIIPMRDNDFKIQILKSIDISQLHSCYANDIISLSTLSYEQNFVIDESYLSSSSLTDRVNRLSPVLRDTRQWIDERLTELNNLSISLFPHDPVSSKFSFEHLNGGLRIKDEYALVAWERLLRDLNSYRDFVIYSSEIVGAIERHLEYVSLPTEIRHFFGNVILILEYIMDKRLWPISGVRIVEMQILAVKNTLNHFVEAVRACFLSSDYGSSSSESSSSSKPSPLVSKKSTRFLVWYYQRNVNRASHMHYYCCGKGTMLIHQTYATMVAAYIPSIERHNAICESMTYVRDEYFGFPHMLRQFKREFIDRRHAGSHTAQLLAEQEVKRLTHYLKRFSILNNYISQTTIACQAEQCSRKEPMAGISTDSVGIFVRVEIYYLTSLAVRYLRSNLSTYNTIKKLFAENESIVEALKKKHQLTHSETLEETEKLYHYPLWRTTALRDLFKRLDFSENHVKQIYDFQKAIVNFNDSYGSDKWKALVRKFFALKGKMQKVELMHRLINHLQVLVAEHGRVIDNFKGNIAASVKSMEGNVVEVETSTEGEMPLKDTTGSSERIQASCPTEEHHELSNVSGKKRGDDGVILPTSPKNNASRLGSNALFDSITNATAIASLLSFI